MKKKTVAVQVMGHIRDYSINETRNYGYPFGKNSKFQSLTHSKHKN